jgi:hypothetical protein
VLEISDHDLLGANDFLGGATLNMGKVVLEAEELFEGILRHNAEKAARGVAVENGEGSGSESDDEEHAMVVLKNCVLMGKDGQKDIERGRVQVSFTWEPNSLYRLAMEMAYDEEHAMDSDACPRAQRAAVSMEFKDKLQSVAARSSNVHKHSGKRYTKRAEDGSGRALRGSDRALQSSGGSDKALESSGDTDKALESSLPKLSDRMSDTAATRSELAIVLSLDTAAARSEFGLTAKPITPTEPIRRILGQKHGATGEAATHTNWEQDLRARKGTVALSDLTEGTTESHLQYGDVRVIV